MSDSSRDDGLDLAARLRSRGALPKLRDVQFGYGAEYRVVYRRGEEPGLVLHNFLRTFYLGLRAVVEQEEEVQGAKKKRKDREREGTLNLYIGTDEPIHENGVLVERGSPLHSEVLQLSDGVQDRLEDFAAKWTSMEDCLRDLLDMGEGATREGLIEALADSYRKILPRERRLSIGRTKEIMTLDEYKVFVGEIFDAMQVGQVYVSVLATRPQDRIQAL